MSVHFDAIADDYDRDFTFSETGRRQRARVHGYLRQLLAKYPVKQALELNCGTGEDAVFLARQGIRVLATDISTAMVQATARKAAQYDLSHLLSTQVCAFQELQSVAPGGAYDLILSDFGGLNCLPPDDFPAFATAVGRLLSPGGIFVAVVMSRFCIWETLYFLSRGRWRAAFRRSGNQPVMARLDDDTYIPTWYYAPSGIRSFFEGWNYLQSHPIGLFLPPSYLEPFFKNKTPWLDRLSEWEAGTDVFPGWSDHYLIVFQR